MTRRAYLRFLPTLLHARMRVRTEVPNGVNKEKGVTVAPDPKAREDAMAKIDALLRKRGFVY